MEEKRKFARIPFKNRAAISGEMGSVEGEVANLSLNGLFLKTEDVLEVGAAVKIDIHLSGSEPEINIPLDGEVIRQVPGGIAIQFAMSAMPIETLTHLRNIIGFNSGDPDSVMQEYYDYLDSRQKR